MSIFESWGQGGRPKSHKPTLPFCKHEIKILAKIEAANHWGRFTYIEVCKILIFSQSLLVNELRKKYLFELNILLVLAVLLFA